MYEMYDMREYLMFKKYEWPNVWNLWIFEYLKCVNVWMFKWIKILVFECFECFNARTYRIFNF